MSLLNIINQQLGDCRVRLYSDLYECMNQKQHLGDSFTQCVRYEIQMLRQQVTRK